MSGRGVESEKPRPLWSFQWDGMAVILSYTIGCSNAMVFPYRMYSSGGILYMIPYCLAMIVVGFPIVLLQMSIGQFCSKSSSASRIYSPLFRGLGFTLIIVNIIILMYTTYLSGTNFRYLIASFTSVLPWDSCDNVWNTAACVDINQGNDYNYTYSGGYRDRHSPTYEYYQYVVLKEGGYQWEILLCSLFLLGTAFLALILDVRSVGKVAYVTFVLPFLILLALLVRSSTLPGSIEGIHYLLYPSVQQLLDIQVWTGAVSQVAYGTGIAGSIFVSLSSFHRFHNCILRDAIAVCVSHLIMEFFVALMVFGFLGALAWWEGMDMSSVVTSGIGLKFTALPRLFSHIPLSSLWSGIFFFFNTLLGFGYLCPMILNITAQIADEIKLFRQYKIVATFITCGIIFIGCLFLCAWGLLFSVLDFYVVPILLITLLTEVISIGWCYGSHRLADNIKVMMSCSRLWTAWRVLCILFWSAATPLLLGITLFVSLFYWYDYIREPVWIVSVAWVVVVLILLITPAYAVYYGLRYGFGKSLKELLTPAPEWGPVLEQHRQKVTEAVPFMNWKQTEGYVLQPPPGVTAVGAGAEETLMTEKPKTEV